MAPWGLSLPEWGWGSGEMGRCGNGEMWRCGAWPLLSELLRLSQSIL